MWNNKTVSLIFPAYNEMENIQAAIQEHLELELVDELVVIDNNCTDSTFALASEMPVRVLRETTQGYGAAMIAGLGAATGDLVIMSEPDGTFDPRDLIRLLEASRGRDCVFGTRTDTRHHSPSGSMKPLVRFGNRVVARWTAHMLRGTPLTDCGCSLRLLTRRAVDTIAPELGVTGGALQMEITTRCYFHRFAMAEIPVTYRKRVGASKITGTLWGAFRNGTRMVRIAAEAYVRVWSEKRRIQPGLR